MAKSRRVAYLLWFFGGPFAFHHVYLGRDLQALVWWCTCGGFLLGWIRDFWRIPEYVAEANSEPAYVEKLTEEMRKNPQPKTSGFRSSGTTFLGSIFGSVLVSAIPHEPTFGHNIEWLYIFSPLAVSTGTWVVGNIGSHRGSIKYALMASYATHFLYKLVSGANSPPSYLCSLASSWAFGKKSKEWRRSPRKPRNLCIRITILLAFYSVFLGFILSALYFNAEITDQNGETVKLRDSFGNVLNSPLWGELRKAVGDLYTIVRTHGWRRLWDELAAQMDFQGENNALKVLGLESSANQTEITQRWKKLSREWHPDKQRDPEKKAEAHSKFTEIQAAYARLSEIKNRRLKKNTKDRSSTAAEKIPDEF